MRKNKGFTLVEILIVVVILGILAAIVIPQFSEASTEARLNSLSSNLQTIRSQLSLYKIQHNDLPPTSAALFEDEMTGFTLQDRTVLSAADAATAKAAGTQVFGPYLQSVPANPFSGSNTVDGSGDWTYTAADGTIIANDGGTTNGVVHADM